MYSILSLENPAEKNIKTFEGSVDIRHILGVARSVFLLFESRDGLLLGYKDHLRKKEAGTSYQV